MTDLLELAGRCKLATGPSFVLDRVISDAMGHGDVLVRNYTASLDTAMTLVPDGHIWMVANAGVSGLKPDFSVCTATVGHPEATHDPTVEAATPALALCAASLRALAQSGEKM